MHHLKMYTSRALILLLTTALMSACSREDTQGTSSVADSTQSITAEHIRLEKAISDYYTSIEQEVLQDLGVSKSNVIDRVQAMIDDGYARKPVILVITDDGPRWATVDYATYKEYMTSNAVVLRRYYGTQPDLLDTVYMDSIRQNLLKAFNE